MMAIPRARITTLSQLSPLLRRIARGIVDDRSYREIAADCAAAGLTCRSWHTVRRHVERMAGRIELEADFDVLPPRHRVRVWAGRQRWEAEHATSLPKSA